MSIECACPPPAFGQEAPPPVFLGRWGVGATCCVQRKEAMKCRRVCLCVVGFRSYSVRHVLNESQMYPKSYQPPTTVNFPPVFPSPFHFHSMLISHVSKITWNWNTKLLGANIDFGGRGGAQKKKTSQHTNCRSLSGRDITVLYLFAFPENIYFGDNE